MRTTRVEMVALLLLSACSNSPLTIAPPRVTYGGRAVAIAVRSDSDKRIVVASETGGLFRTFDGGKSWQHLDNLPNNRAVDVVTASSAPDIVIATTLSQYRKVSDGGIWRSGDGGASWAQATGWAPAPSRNCPTRPSAYGISHMPLSRTIYIGTDCGLAISSDNGATWSNVVLEPLITRNDSLYNRVRAVLVVNRTSGVLARDNRLWRLDQTGQWVAVDGGPVPYTPLPPFHSLASPWWSGLPIFFYTTGGQKLWVTSDGGANWLLVPSPSAQMREAFVRVSRPQSGKDATEFDVYYGDGMKMHRRTFKIADLTAAGTWTNLPSDHEDPADIAFDAERRTPILLASDGGVHLTSDKGAHWKLTGGGYGGFTALQITEVTGQEVSGSKPHLDLYYVSHDDDFKASPDGGATWPGYRCCEGKHLRVLPTSVDHQKARVTALACGPCSIFLDEEHLTHDSDWKSPPSGHPNDAADAPFPISDDVYVQSIPNAGPPASSDFYVTTNAGTSWALSYSITRPIVGPVILSGSTANPTIFQGTDRGTNLTNGGKRYGLTRITNVFTQPSVVSVDSFGIDGFGSMRNTNQTRLVIAVDPQNPYHLLTADAGTGQMKYSANGGREWYDLPQLTDAVTGNGRYFFTKGEKTFATTIAWDPYDSCHILVGTQQNGIIRSTDGGQSWTQIAGSTHATSISSFYFPSKGPVWVSSDGRGLWTLSVQRDIGLEANRCRFPSPIDRNAAILARKK